jgi:hypothetical protein
MITENHQILPKAQIIRHIQHVCSTLAVTRLFEEKVFAQRLTMPVSHSVNHTAKQLQTVHFWRVFSFYLCCLVDLVMVAVDE